MDFPAADELKRLVLELESVVKEHLRQKREDMALGEVRELIGNALDAEVPE